MASIPRSSTGAPAGGLALPGWRGRLLLAVAAGAALGWFAGDPSGRLGGDAELARLLRGMALVKALLVVGAVRLLWWRFGEPIGARRAWGYVAAVAAMALATLLAWQLSQLALLALVFHGALLSLGVLALRDDGVALAPRRR